MVVCITAWVKYCVNRCMKYEVIAMAGDNSKTKFDWLVMKLIKQFDPCAYYGLGK